MRNVSKLEKRLLRDDNHVICNEEKGIIKLMDRRLEKYYVLCNTAFLILFTMKFVRYTFILCCTYIRQNTLYNF